MDAAEFLSPQLGTEDLLLLHAYWAKLERNLGKDPAATRGVWENALKISGSVLEVWQHYISMEIEMGHIHEARLLYKRCYSKRLAGSGSEGLAYVDFSDSKHLEAAIRKNKQKLLGKKVSIARSDPRKRKKNREAGSFSKGQDNLPPRGDYGEKAPVANRPEKAMPKSDTKITGKNTFAAPRAVVKPLGWTKKDDKSDGGAEELKSNKDFRNLLLKK